MVKLEKYQGVAANFSTTFTLLFASLTGMPVSTGHCYTSAMMGVGSCGRLPTALSEPSHASVTV